MEGTAAWTGRLRGAVEDLAAAVRRWDRYFRLRAGVVAAWVAVSLVTFVATCPSGGPGNALGADVQFLGESFVGGAQILVRNDSDDVWRDVVVTIDREWSYRHPTLRPREQVVVPTGHFLRGAEPLAAEHRPRRVEVACDQGRHGVDVR